MKPALVLAAMLTAGPAAAQVLSQRPDAVAVVLYQDRARSLDQLLDEAEFDDPGLAVVTETRTVDLPAGRSRISFRAVADGIVPQTVALDGLAGRLVERDYDFDLLSPGSLLQKAVGQPARLVRTNSKTGKAVTTAVTVRSGPSGIVLQQTDGTAEALGCAGLPERLVFDGAPPGLNPTPTLSVTVEPPAAGRYVVKLSYLATGLSWRADYVARVRPDGRTLDLTGWLTLSNQGSTTFGDAPTQVVAGRLARVEGADEAPAAQVVEARRSCWPERRAPVFKSPLGMALASAPAPAFRASGLEEVVVTATRQATVSNLGDYKLYTLPEPTTVAARQTKQVAFLQQPATPFQRVYDYRAGVGRGPQEDRIERAHILLRMQNRKADGLGQPLPGGAVTVFEPGLEARLFLAGQDMLKDTPVGLPLEIEEGLASDVTVTTHQISNRLFVRRGRDFEVSDEALTIRNTGPQPATVEIRLAQPDIGITAQSLPHTRKGAFALWAITVPPGDERTLRYKAEAPL